MNSVAVNATTPIASPPHIFQSTARAVLPYADFVPTRTARSTSTQKSGTTLGPIGRAMLAQQELAQRKTLRTVMRREDGTIVGARIDQNGEVVPYEYKDYFARPPRPKANPDAPDLDPFWMKLTPAERRREAVGKPDRSRNKTFNSVKVHLQRLIEQVQNPEEVVAPTSLSQAVDARLPSLAAIIESANTLDMDGNSRGLCVGVILAMLLHMDTISAGAIRDFTGYSRTHSERYASCLRVIVSAFDRKVRGKH